MSHEKSIVVSGRTVKNIFWRLSDCIQANDVVSEGGRALFTTRAAFFVPHIHIKLMKLGFKMILKLHIQKMGIPLIMLRKFLGNARLVLF